MGTNFYLHENACTKCGRSETIHVGKRSAGWSFGFRGYRHDPDDGLYSPFDENVRSRADWVGIVAGFNGVLRDEYGETVEVPVAWLKGLEPPDAKRRRFEDSNMGPYWRPDERDWRDAEGFRFYDGDFS